MNHKEQLREIMYRYGFKTKKCLLEKIKQLLHSTEIGVIIEKDNLLHDLLKLHPQYKTHDALYFTVSIDSQYKTKHFSFCDKNTRHVIGVSYLSCMKGRVMN